MRTRLVTKMSHIAEMVMNESEGRCQVCHGHGVDLHHIISGNGKRLQHQNQYSVILLCKECHMGTHGVHGKHGRTLDLKLKLRLQEKYKELGFNEEEIRELMGGKIYLKER